MTEKGTCRARHRDINRPTGDKVFDAVIFAVLTGIFLIVAYPLYFIVISSLSDPVAVARGQVVFLPIGFTFDGYRMVFNESTVMSGFLNSLQYTAIGVSINLLTTIPTAYALSRSDLYGRRVITWFYLLTTFVGGGLMPTYLVVKQLHMLDTVWALVLPGSISVYNMIVARTFFKTNLPAELFEAAKLDGCGNTQFFVRICLPLSGAIIAIMVLYYGVGHWNAYFSALIYITTRSKWPLQLELRSILIQNQMQLVSEVVSEEALAEKARLEALKEMMKYSLIIISSIPVMILYPFVQKYFIKGVMIGSVKG